MVSSFCTCSFHHFQYGIQLLLRNPLAIMVHRLFNDPRGSGQNFLVFSWNKLFLSSHAFLSKGGHPSSRPPMMWLEANSRTWTAKRVLGTWAAVSTRAVTTRFGILWCDSGLLEQPISQKHPCSRLARHFHTYPTLSVRTTLICLDSGTLEWIQVVRWHAMVTVCRGPTQRR